MKRDREKIPRIAKVARAAYRMSKWIDRLAEEHYADGIEDRTLHYAAAASRDYFNEREKAVRDHARLMKKLSDPEYLRKFMLEAMGAAAA